MRSTCNMMIESQKWLCLSCVVLICRRFFVFLIRFSFNLSFMCFKKNNILDTNDMTRKVKTTSVYNKTNYFMVWDKAGEPASNASKFDQLLNNYCHLCQLFF